ncbi:hypothetical protein ACFW2K_10260 [Streptomyces nigra]
MGPTGGKDRLYAAVVDRTAGARGPTPSGSAPAFPVSGSRRSNS